LVIVISATNVAVEAAMHEAEGDLLIGGDRIKHLHIDLEAEQKQDGSAEWTLAGHLHVTAEQSRLLETDRPYRLQLADGRSGQVIVRRIAADEVRKELLADFLPK
jgi:hypothetical protein